jgi:hypothetical protein
MPSHPSHLPSRHENRQLAADARGQLQDDKGSQMATRALEGNKANPDNSRSIAPDWLAFSQSLKHASHVSLTQTAANAYSAARQKWQRLLVRHLPD